MAKNKKKRFKAGEQPEASTLNWISDQLERIQNIRGEGIELLTTDGSISLREAGGGCIYASLDSGGNGGHSWHEVTPGTAGTFVTTPQGMSGTTSDKPAFELNNKTVASGKVVKICPGYDSEWLFEYIASGCSANITASASCIGAITGVTFELLDSAGTTVLATLTGNTVTFTGLSGGTSYKVRASKTGYHTKTSSLISTSCGTTSTVSITTWPTTYNIVVNVALRDNAGDCVLSGATVTISGDGSGSGTTDASGSVTISVSSSSTSITQSLSYSISPPSGTGAATKTGSFSVSSCSPAAQYIILIPDASHVAVICNTRYMPSTLTWTDTYGSCTLSYVGPETWGGSYTYSTTGINEYTCATGGFPPTFTGPYADQPISVTVGVSFSAYSRPSCSSTTFTITRTLVLADGMVSCPFTSYKCQPVDDSQIIFGPPGYANEVTMYPTASVTSTCGTSLSFSFTINAFAAVSCATYSDTAVSVTVTGTI